LSHRETSLPVGWAVSLLDVIRNKSKLNERNGILASRRVPRPASSSPEADDDAGSGLYEAQGSSIA
jgi:hypothetical protein